MSHWEFTVSCSCKRKNSALSKGAKKFSVLTESKEQLLEHKLLGQSNSEERS